MPRIVNFTRLIANGRTEQMSINEDQMVKNEIGVTWRVDDKTIRVIPFAQILEITMRDQ